MYGMHRNKASFNNGTGLESESRLLTKSAPRFPGDAVAENEKIASLSGAFSGWN
jgi:hypothetical protein